MRRSTGDFDSNGEEIFEGDHIIWTQGFVNSTKHGKPFKTSRVMRINYVEDEHRFIMGNVYNRWNGSQLTKVDLEKHPFEVDKLFCIMDDGEINYDPYQLMYTEKDKEWIDEYNRDYYNSMIFGLNWREVFEQKGWTKKDDGVK